MQRLISSIVLGLIVAAGASPALAQADAQKAYEQANAALQSGNLAEARDQAKAASQTDPQNAEVFLLLGKAHYGLGELDEAIKAWKRTLALAPEEPFAKRMLDALRGRTSDVNLRIEIVEAMVRERLYPAAERECGKLLSDKATSDAQRAAVMILQAESLVRRGQGPEARKVLGELTALYPQQADPVQATLLSGEAKLQGDERSTAEALVTLKKLIADQPDTPAAARAQYDVITHDPALAVGAARAEAMAKWLAANADHELADEGRRSLIGTYLAVTLQGPKATAKSDLSPTDVKALALAAEVYGRFLPTAREDALTKQLLDHFEAHYTNRGAYTAAIKAMETLLAAPLPRNSRLSVLKTLASSKYLAAAKQLDEMARAEAMAKWLVANANHELAENAWSSLIGAYLAVTGLGPKATAKSDLSPTDVKALALAAEVFARPLPTASADTLTKQLLDHLKAHYTDRGAHAAAIKAMETLLAAPLPRSNRLSVLKTLASSKYVVAAEWLDETARAGKLPAGVPRGQLPEKLSDVLTVFQTIRKAYPAEPMWIDQANLAKRVRASSAQVLPTAQFRGLTGPDAWALDLAMPAIQDGTDDAAVKSAVETVQGIIQERAALNKPGSRKLAVDLSTELLAAISTDDPNWAGVITSYYTVVQNYTPYVFQDNIKDGRGEENAKLSDVQKAYLATLKRHVLLEARHAPFAVVQLAEHVKPWVEHGHWTVVEEAYAAVVDALPEKERRHADLAVVNLWIAQVTREHQRLIAAGLTVPRQLDPALEKALKRCYELQTGLDDEPAILAQVRGVWDGVLNHYRTLEYHDVVNAAIAVKLEQAVAAADEYAEFTQARELDLAARRELTRLLKQYGAAEKIVLGPAFQKAIAAYTKFITDRPTSPLIERATGSVLGVGRLFEQHKAYLVAAGVYGDFAKFAAGVSVLSQAAPGTSSEAELAAFAVAVATDAQARKILAEQAARRKSDDPPPAKLSDEFVAAIAAYKGFIGAHPESPLMAQATSKIMAVALEYAKIDAWEVAEEVYADLLGSKLEIRRPERLKFARGLCQLGRAMPDHARQVLSALTTTGLRGGGTSSESGIQLVTLPRRESRSVGGGVAGADMPAGASQPAKEPPGARIVEKIADLAARPAPLQPPTSAPAQPSDEADRDSQLLAVIRQQQSSRAAQVAQLRDSFAYANLATAQMDQQQGEQQAKQQAVQQVPPVPVLSEAELTRQATAIDAAYKIFQGIRTDHAETPTAEQARGEILVMVGHWRTLGQWQRSAALAGQFLADNRTDSQRPKISLEIARDRLSYASKPIERKASKQERMTEVAKRFDAARAELAKVVAEFPKERSYQQQAQWDVANSYLTQARVVAAFSPTLARGQYVRTAKELTQVARQYPDHPNLGSIPQMLWNISTELEGRGFDDEAILVWHELTIYDPMHGLSQQAAMRIANTYHQKLKRPLLAAEAYQELYYGGGSANQSLLDAIFQIGSDLKNQKRYVEALHVLETFVDSFPRHAQAGQALTMAGQIHQTNEAWKDAIASYRRVVDEFENGQFVQEAKWAIAECTINLSRWREAADAYRDYVKAYPKDAKIEQAKGRIEDLKDLARFQGLVDEENQRKAFDAQFQIATIVRTKLANPVKAIIEFRKVTSNWPTSHLADDALYEVGATYVSLGETEKAREALLAVAEKYPTSPLADDALFMVGKSFEDEAGQLATATRATTLERNKEVAQRRAYQVGRGNLKKQQEFRDEQIADLKQAGKGKLAEAAEARFAGNYGQFNAANTTLIAQKASQEVETATATQLADRQDKINAALRKAVEAYTSASKVGGADKADEALLQMATIYDQQLKDPEAAMQTWLEIVAQFSGTTVAEDASWRIAETYERQGEYAKAIDAYNEFLRNYRGRERAGAAQFAVAENYEHLGKWVNAMDAYTNYVTNYPEGPLVTKAKQQINWIKTYRL